MDSNISNTEDIARGLDINSLQRWFGKYLNDNKIATIFASILIGWLALFVIYIIFKFTLNIIKKNRKKFESIRLVRAIGRYTLIFVGIYWALICLGMPSGEFVFADFGLKIFQAVLILVIGKLVATFLEKILDRRAKMASVEKRNKTIYTMIGSLVKYVLYFIALVMVLSLFGVDTKAILASAGVLGVALGFGAQNLVKDLIAGFFIVFEDQYAVGDYIEAAGVKGTVEYVSMRSTSIRDYGGQLHTFPNGILDVVSNFSRGDLKEIIDISVDSSENIEHVKSVLNDACEKMWKEHGKRVASKPELLGVQTMTAHDISIRLVVNSNFDNIYAASRIFRQICKAALDEAKIKYPFDRQLMVYEEETNKQSERDEKAEERRKEEDARVEAQKNRALVNEAQSEAGKNV